MSAIDADDTLLDLEPPSCRLAARIAMVVSFTGYLAYLTYRIFFTFNFDAPIFSALVLAAEIHGGFLLAFFYHSVWRLTGRVPPDPAPDLTVDVFVTTYNEDVEMVRQTVRAAIAMRHPHNTYVLDDGRRPEMAAMAAEVGAIYITRPDNRHAKAGNVNHAFHQTHGDVISRSMPTTVRARSSWSARSATSAIRSWRSCRCRCGTTTWIPCSTWPIGTAAACTTTRMRSSTW